MIRLPTDDLFKDSSMTFGEHLRELRKCLFKSVIALFIGIALGMCVGNYVVHFIQTPLSDALQDYYIRNAEETLKNGGVIDAPPEAVELVKQQNLLFEQVYLDPSAVMASARAAYGNGNTAAWQTPPQFRIAPSDLLSPKILSGVLVASEEGGATPAKRIWQTLDVAQHAYLREIANASTPSEQQLQQLADALNKALDSKDFYEAVAFDKIPLNDETKTLLERRNSLPPGELSRLNWHLLNAALPGMVTEPHPLLVPMLLWRPASSDPRLRPVALGTEEGFVIWLKASMLAGVLLASPWVFYYIWTFVAAGLYPHERKYIHIYLPFSLGLFLLGAAMAFFIVFKPVLHFFIEFNEWLGLDFMPRISEWLHLVLLLPLMFGLSFQLPLVMLFMDRIGIVTVAQYLSYWRIAIFSIFVAAAVLTPTADPTSMMLMAGPLLVLYGFGILLCKYLPATNRPSLEEPQA